MIQQASERALARGIGLTQVLGCVRDFRRSNTTTPVVLMGYANPVERYDQTHGAGRFIRDAAEAGVDGLLVVDYPPEECVQFSADLQAAGLDLTLLRPSVIFGAQDRFLNTFAQLQQLAPFMPLAFGAARFQPVWVGDVAAAIATALERPDTAGQVFECAGPREATLSELVRLSGLWAGVLLCIAAIAAPAAIFIAFSAVTSTVRASTISLPAAAVPMRASVVLVCSL